MPSLRSRVASPEPRSNSGFRICIGQVSKFLYYRRLTSPVAGPGLCERAPLQYGKKSFALAKPKKNSMVKINNLKYRFLHTSMTRTLD